MLRKYFWLNDLFLSSKEVFLHNFRQFLENWIFDGNWKLVTIWNCARKYFLAKLFIPFTKEVFLHNAVFGKLNFWRKFDSRGPYKNSEN